MGTVSQLNIGLIGAGVVGGGVVKNLTRNAELIAERTEVYRTKFSNPFIAGSRGFIDDVIMPRDTRTRICRSLNMLKNKKLENPWRKHGNIPL